SKRRSRSMKENPIYMGFKMKIVSPTAPGLHRLLPISPDCHGYRKEFGFPGAGLALLLGILLALLFPAAARAEGSGLFETFTVYLENDAFTGTDRDYTNGLKLTWATGYEPHDGDGHLPAWVHGVMDRLPFLQSPENLRALSLSVSQNIYTPEDTDRSDLIKDDRPYAGIISVAAGLHARTGRQKDTWEFSLGLLGPHSYAEEAQNWVHDLTHSKRARGWDNQLEDELLVDIVYERQWRLFQSTRGSGFNYDFSSHLGGRIGNVAVYANAGVEIRFGWQLPTNFGTCPIRLGCEADKSNGRSVELFSPGSPFTYHGFVGIDGRVLLRDITLDGNTFKESHSVDRKSLVADVMVGISVEYGRLLASYAYIFRSHQFEEQDYNPSFGAVRLSYAV
ncbi:MAG: lipid A deacylase LpxR family protein, partial [bacterium]|nr:lipid A deacylase LpxR family protein [bacterium]